MDNDEVEAMIRHIIEEHLAEDSRKAALEWLEDRVVVFQAMREFGLLPLIASNRRHRPEQ
jgi:hypothetical protein